MAFLDWIRNGSTIRFGDPAMHGPGHQNTNQERTTEKDEDNSDSTKLKSKNSDLEVSADTTLKTPKKQRKIVIWMRRVLDFLPKRIVVAILIFISMSVYFMIYTSFSMLLLTMVEHNKSITSKEIIYANVGKRYPWDNRQQIQVLNVFSVGEAISCVPSGILVEKKGPRLIMTIGFALAGLMSFIIPFGARVSISLMGVWRLLQGFFCSQIILGSHFLISQWSPRHEQCTFIWSLLGSMVGSTYTSVITITLLKRFRDYYIVFYVTGSIAIVWSVIWYLSIADSPRKHSIISDKELNYILRSVDPVLESKFTYISLGTVFYSTRFWALIVINFSYEYGLFTIIIFAPTFFEEFFQKMTIWQTFLPQIGRLIFALICSVIVDLLSRRRFKFLSRTMVVKIFVIFSHLLPGILLCLLHGVFSKYEHIYVIYICSITCMGAVTVTSLNLFHDMTPNHSAQVAGYARMISLVVAVILRHLCGAVRAIKSNDEAWSFIFYLAAAIYFFGFIFYMLLGSSKLQKWNFPETSYKYYIFEVLTNVEAETKQKTN